MSNLQTYYHFDDMFYPSLVAHYFIELFLNSAQFTEAKIPHNEISRAAYLKENISIYSCHSCHDRWN